MVRTLRLAGLQIALAAMVLRALLPAGWMPGHVPGAALTICTAEGRIIVHAPALPGHPAAPSDRDHPLCPFASAVHFAVAADAIVLPAPSLFGRTRAPARGMARHATLLTPYSPRGPPVLV